MKGQLEEQSINKTRTDEGNKKVSDAHYAIISTIYHSLQGHQTACQYEKDARNSGKEILAKFFAEVQEEELRRVSKAKEFLKEWMMEGSNQQEEGRDFERENEEKEATRSGERHGSPSPIPTALSGDREVQGKGRSH